MKATEGTYVKHPATASKHQSQSLYIKGKGGSFSFLKVLNFLLR